MLLANILIGLTTAVTLLLGLFIFLSNPRRGVNRALSAFIFSIFIWLLANLLTNTASDPAATLFFGRTTLIGPALLSYTFLIFAKMFVRDRTLTVKRAVGYAVLPLLIILTFPSDLNIRSIEAYGRNTVTGPIYFVLVPMILIYFGIGLRTLIKRYRTSKSNIEKLQLRYVFVGCLLSLVPGVIANGVLPALGYGDAVFYGPSTILFMAIFTSVAIAKHQLLDIRLVVARSLAYLLLLFSLVSIYGLVVFGLAGVLFGSTSFAKQVVPIFTALLLTFTSPYLRRIFDRVTNKLFYQDAYDPQVFLKELNTIHVSHIELDELLHETTEVIKSNLKASYAVFSIRDTSYFPIRIIGDHSKQFEVEDIGEVSEITSHIHEKVIVADYLEENNVELKKVLHKSDIAVLVRLVATLDYDVKGIGYLFLGPKRSGNPYSKQDVQTLEIIANELVIAVQNALRFEEIEKFNATLQEKIDDATKQLQKTNDKLQALDETKDEFISMASHQLRTPLTSVKGYLSMVLEGDTGEITEMQRKLLDQAFTSSQRMVYLIADLLNVSRLRTGKFLIEPIATNLADVVESEVHQLAETAKGRGLTLTYDKPANFPTLMLDETKIRQVMMNFMDNAIYYAKPNGHVTVDLKETDKTIEFTVTDDGIGVPKSEQHHLFTKFYRAGNAKKARPDGTGLGLFMAKKVIVAQGGAIIFKSEQDKGSTFGFSFDKSKLQPQVSAESTSV